MELMLAMKLEEMSVMELEQILFKLRIQDQEAFDLLKEVVEDEA